MSTTPSIGVPPAEAKACRFSSCVQLFVDGELDPGRAMDVETHLADCEACAERAALLRSLKGSLRRACEGRAPESLRAKICLVVAKEASLEAGATEAMPPHEATGRESFLHGLRESRHGFGRRDGRPIGRGENGGRGELARSEAARIIHETARDNGTVRGNRVAYGVGALALAAGVVLALLGERVSSEDRLAEGDRSGRDRDGLTEPALGAAGVQEPGQRFDPGHRIEPGQRFDPGHRIDPQLGQGRVGQLNQGQLNQGQLDHGQLDHGQLDLGQLNHGKMGLGGAELVQVNAPDAATGPELSPRAAGPLLPGAAVEARTTFDAMLDDLAALHANPLPPETTNPDELRKFEPIVGVKLRRPTFRAYDARFRGARLHAMRDTQRAAMLQYVVRNDHRVTVYLFDPRAIPFGATRMQRRLVQEEPVYVGQFRGYSVAAAERRGVGYAVATDLDTDDCVKMVASAIP